VAPYPPTPPLAGGRRRTLELVRALEAVASVTLASITFGPEDEATIARLGRCPCDVVVARPTVDDRPSHLPSEFGWAWSSELARRIEDRHRGDPFDLAIASHSFTFPFIASLRGARKVIDAHNVEHRIHAQFAALPPVTQERLRALAGSGGDGYGRSDVVAVRAFEEDMWALADAVICVSEQERSLVEASPGAARTLLLPNASTPVQSPQLAAGTGESVVAFGGALNYIPNIDAVVTLTAEVMPLVSASVGGARLVVAGRDPTPALVHLCTRHDARVISNPVDLFASIAGSVIAVPLRMGAGSRIKVLEARAHGLPVVASAMAVEGLDVTADPGVVVADSCASMAEAITALLRQKGLVKPPPWPVPTWDDVLLGALDKIGSAA
jgi:glycosyltransferase involved in cell wall biosynthesis